MVKPKALFYFFSLKKINMNIARKEAAAKAEWYVYISLNTGYTLLLKKYMSYKINDVVYATTDENALHTMYFFILMSLSPITANVCKCTENPPQHNIAAMRE